MKKLLIILIVTLSIILAGVLVFVFFQLRPSVPEHEITSGEGELHYTGAPFITNLRDSKHKLKTDIYIEVATDDDLKLVEQNNIRIRDRIILILRNITEKDVDKEDFEESLKNNIKNDLQNTINIDRIVDIYINELVVQ